jgi:hypothetical protein
MVGSDTRAGKRRNFRKTRNSKKPIRKKQAAENDDQAGLKMIAKRQAKVRSIDSLIRRDLPMMRPRGCSRK